MNTLQVHARTGLEILSVNLSDLICLPDAEAADELNQRMSMWSRVEELRERSYVERGIIAREFERRELWRHLIDPESGLPFTSFSAWMSCPSYLGCRRTNFEAKGDVKMLEGDVPVDHLAQITDKGNIKTLIGMSSAVRKQPEVLAAAKTLDNEQFLERIERTHPDQHLERKRDFRFSVPASEYKEIEETISFAIEHDIAGTRDEAVLMALKIARMEWEREQVVMEVFPEENP